MKTVKPPGEQGLVRSPATQIRKPSSIKHRGTVDLPRMSTDEDFAATQSLPNSSSLSSSPKSSPPKKGGKIKAMFFSEPKPEPKIEPSTHSYEIKTFRN